MIQNGPSWTEREIELLLALRPHCETKEIVEVFSKLGYDRNYEAISRKARRLNVKFQLLGEVSGDFTEEESKAIDEVIGSNSSRGKNLVLESIKSEYIEPLDAESEGIIVDLVEVVESEEPPQTKLPGNVKWVTGALPLKERTLRYVQLNDVHVPHNISLKGIFSFIEDFKPDYIMLVGDIVNNDPFDHWAKEKPGKAKKLPSPRPYYEQCNDILFRPMRKAAGLDCKVVFSIGNHEYWSNKAIDEIPEGEGYWEVWNNLESIDLWVPFKQIVSLGKLYFVHGDIIKGGKYHSQQMLQYFNRNVRYGHYHDIQESSQSSPIDVKDRHTARCCGCLEKYNPGFMENRPHNWQNAFTFGYVRPDGTFNDSTVVIVNDRFIANNKEYQG